MCDVNDPRILNAYIAITEDEPTDWLLLGYKDTRDKITLYASGVNGLSEFREHITNEILFGFVRVDDRFILITYVPDSVSGVRRARALVHSRSIAGILELSHAQFTASTLSDMSDANIRTRLKLTEKQVPNRSRPTSMQSKRSSTIAASRRRKSASSQQQYIPSPSPSPSPMSERNLRIYTTTTEDPLSYDQEDIDRMMNATPTPSTPTSVASSFAESSISTLVDSNALLELDDKKRTDATEAFIQLQLAKKKELEEARFKQFQRDQQEERFKRDQAIKRFEEDQKKQKEEQQKPAFMLKRASLQPKKSFIQEQAKAPQVVLRKVVPAIVAQPKVVVKESKAAKIETKSDDSIIKPQAAVVAELNIKKKHAEEPVPIKQEEEKRKIIEKQVLMTGFASVQTKSSPFWKRRYFVIKNDCMSFYRDELAKVPISDINLLNVTRLAPANEDEDTYVPNSFIIDTPLPELYQIFADDKKIVKQIYATLQSIIKL